jgi:hypothetical protein
MRGATILLLPLLGVAALVAGPIILDGTNEELFFRVQPATMKLIGGLGMLVAAFSFGRRDYLMRPWLFQASTYLLLALRDAFIMLEIMPASPIVRGGWVVIVNALGVIGIVLFARAYHVAGLDYPGSPRRRLVAIIIGILVAFGATGYGMYLDARAVAGGELAAIGSLASSLGDAISLSLIVPLLLTAIALRGGMLARIWILLTASQMSWLGYDVLAFVSALPDADGAALRLPLEIMRTLACTLAASAGLVQREAVRSPRLP